MTLRLNGSTSGYTEIDAPAVAGSNTLVLPSGNGTSGQALQTNGSGALSWGVGVANDGQLCKAWVNFNGTGTVAIRASYNVSSITDNGLGRYTINLTSALADTNYAWAGCVRGDNDATSVPRLIYALNTGTKTSSALAIVSSYGADLVDYPEVNVAIFR